MRKYISTAVLLLIFIGISACSNEEEFSFHEPGVYKGTEDPLVAEGEHELKDRFMKVQAAR